MTMIRLASAGERLEVVSDQQDLADVVSEVGTPIQDDGPPTLRVVLESSREPFATEGLLPLARGALAGGDVMIVRDVATSGFDLRVDADEAIPTLTYRWRPGTRTRMAKVAWRARHRLLVRAVLVQYPVLWRAGMRDRAPLHAAAVTAGEARPLLAGPGGVGKSTLVGAEVVAGGRSTGDNLAVADGKAVWGLVEPVRAEGGNGRKMPHGRTESALSRRADRLEPDRIVILRRGDREEARVDPASPDEATRALVTGTYAARELQRYWSFAALLALGTGLGPAHPPVEAAAQAFARALPAVTITLPRRPGVRLVDLLTHTEAVA
jgi:hypothetical protein